VIIIRSLLLLAMPRTGINTVRREGTVIGQFDSSVKVVGKKHQRFSAALLSATTEVMLIVRGQFLAIVSQTSEDPSWIAGVGSCTITRNSTGPLVNALELLGENWATWLLRPLAQVVLRRREDLVTSRLLHPIFPNSPNPCSRK